MDSDSEGEELGIIRPTLIRELRNVLDEYPDDGQILKEMIQNAEDAGASTVKFVSDSRQFNQEVSPTDIRKNPWLKFFKGPAVYAYNDAQFTDRDWQGIRMIHTSIKETDPLKVGRFGLGFKSVFHLTDRVTIISGSCLLYIDPFKDEARCCILKKLSRTKPQERKCLLEGLGGTPGISEEMFLSGHYPGTMFWFPLRQEANELSANVYSVDKVNDLCNAFRMEASGILLFLKKIESVELYTEGQDTGLSLDFGVGHAASCLESVRRENKSFIDGIICAGNQIPASDVCNSLVKEMEMTSYSPGHRDTRRETWLVVNYHPGQANMSADLLALCEDPQLSHKPYVGLAAPLEGQRDFQGQIFCFLPLPPESRSPTGLPLHVNGYFSLSQNRRHIKWPTADPLSHQAHMEPALRWNCLLVEQLLPACYVILLTRLQELDSTSARRFYSTWPDVNTVTDRWQPLVRPVFVTMATRAVYLTEGGQWAGLAQAVLSTIPDDVSDDVRRTVHKAYVICGEHLLVLPQNVLEGLKVSRCLSTVAVTTPQRLSQMLQACLCQFESTERHLLLSYLCRHGDFSLLDGLQLLPLEDGAFGVFTSASSPVFFCQEPDVRLFPGLEAQFCSCGLPRELLQQLHDVAMSGLFSLRKTADKDVGQLLMNSIQVRFGSHEPRVPVDNTWLQDVWHFLNEKFSDSLQDFLHIPLLPLLVDNTFVLKPLAGAYVCGQVSGMEPVPDNLATCLRRLGVAVFPHLPEYVTRHPQVLGRLVQWPSAQGIVSLLSCISDDENSKQDAVITFNQTSTHEDRTCLVKLLDDCWDTTLSSNLQKLLQQLHLFHCLPDNTITNIACVQAIAPHRLPPVPFSRQMLLCQGSRDRKLALRLGGHEESLVDMCRDILEDMQPGRETHSLEQKQAFMKFFLDELLDEKSLHQLAKKVKFLSTSPELKAVEDLYEPSRTLLTEVFKADEFPCGDDDFVGKLQKLGLRDESQVSAEELLAVAEQLNVCCHDHASIRRAKSFWTLLTSERLRVDLRALHPLSRHRCLPVLHASSLPESYPCELPVVCPEEVLLPPEDVYPYHYLSLVGSVAPVADKQLGSHELFKQEPSVKTVLKHLANIIKCYSSHNCLKFRSQLNAIFSYFDKHRKHQALLEALKATPCLLVESEAVFLRPSSFWIENNPDDIDLRPYRFRLSTETSTWQNLLVSCGTSARQDCSMLLEVLSEIQASYLQQTSHKPAKSDLKLVLQILESLKDFPSEERTEVILPVAHPDRNVLLFRPAIECTVADTLWLLEADSKNSGDDDIALVHPSVPKPTALALGALSVMDRALDETEDIDYGYHQDQPITTQLHNLLEDYTDGFSVPRELIQNADDAGATEVKFLLDERQNEDCREHLLNPDMASLQGPALWVYNDATFSDHDFENITRLGASAKKNDASKVGKFGLGFNAVYNLTDVPCFLSRHTMAWFDPHKRHLPRRNLGMRIDLNLSKNRSLVKLVPSQFKPFEGVFGCSFQQDNLSEYSATIFRLPFRSEEQAAVSKIKMESYSPEKRRQLLVMLMERAGNLLLFTQNVKSLEVFYLPRDAVSPTSVTCLMSVTKASQVSAHGPQPGLHDHTESILKYCTRRFQDFFQKEREAPDIRVTENVVVTLDVRPDAATTCHVAPCHSQTNWLITWASGTNQSARMASDNKEQGLVPLAAAAVPLDDNNIMSMNNCPFGFYRHGHLFCFLPLPDQIQQPVLPVHMNGTFAVTSSRQNLLITTEENIGNRGGDWNKALFSDAVCRSYLLLLEYLQTTVVLHNHTDYYKLWPRLDTRLSLAESFYTSVINDHFRVFPGLTHSVSFQEARFLDIAFRRCPVGDLAFHVVSEFWENQVTLVDIPDEVYNNFTKTQQADTFTKKCLAEDEFYETVFFPSLTNDFWKTPDRVKVRNTLTWHAVVRGSDRVRGLVSHYACIPCQESRDLKTPCHLVHPKREAAALFLPADGRFPQTSGEQDVDFCQRDCLESLLQLGMASSDLPWDDVIQRARSVKDLLALDKNLAFARAHNLIDYLANKSFSNSRPRIQSCPDDVKKELSVIEFLPVRSKPDDWPFPWFADSRESLLAAPRQLYDSKMTNLVACSQKIFANTSSVTLQLKTSEQSRMEVLGGLQLVTREQPIGDTTVNAAVKQLLDIAKYYESHPEPSSIQLKTETVCCELYSFLQECVSSGEQGQCQNFITDHLKSEQIIWTGSQFCHPSRLAFTVKLACPPYLQEIRESDKIRFKVLFQVLGVREKFGTQDMLTVMDEMRLDIGSRTLSDEEVERFSQAAQLFCYARNETEHEDLLDPQQVFLPDRKGILRCVDSLCLDDTSTLKLRDGMHFIHDKFSPETAKALGVKSKNSSIFKRHMKTKKFGQSEKLTNRIKRLLQGYTCDASIFKEFIQNADDAGATEIRFIKDFRRLGTDSVPDGWRELQGPALCVYNNADFTSRDIEGIQNLGEGSKGEEMMKTGQFGVGFNAVYHITDVPSFWTRRDGQDQVICVCDPCRLIPNEGQEPGMELEDIECLKEEYPDMLDGYLGNTFDMSQPATFFRLPLRNKWMAEKSAIQTEPMTASKVSKLLTDFVKEARLCLLFLNNLRKIGIYSTKDGLALDTEYEVEMVIDQTNARKKEAFYTWLKEEGEKMVDDDLNFDIRHINYPETVVSFSVKDSKGVEEKWVQVSRAGFVDASYVPEKLQEDWRREHFRLLPRGGVAVKMQRSEQKTPYRVFCSLPLPGESSLPVHINGHFALEHESRRHLWDRKGDSKTAWNRLMCAQVIAPAYVKALDQVKAAWFGQKQGTNETTETGGKIHDFFALFPSIPNLEPEIWNIFAEAFYQQMISGRHALFPVATSESSNVAWTPVWKDNDFAGFFTRPPGYRSLAAVQSQEPQEQSSSNTVSLPTPTSHQQQARQQPSPAAVSLPEPPSSHPQRAQQQPCRDAPSLPVLQTSPSHQQSGEIEIEETVADPHVADLLKRLNMKIVHLPRHVFAALKQYGASKMREATPSNVLVFLKSCTAETADSCSLKNLPCQLSDLKLDLKDVHRLTKFVQKSPSFSSELAGLPLCLLQSGCLDVFSGDRQPFVTPLHCLFPMLSEEFLHGSVLRSFRGIVEKAPNFLRKFSINHLAERLPCCLDPTVFKTGQPCPINSALIHNRDWVNRLWEILQVASRMSIEALQCLNEWSLIPCKIALNGECVLYPIQDRGKVLFLPDQERTNEKKKERPLVPDRESEEIDYPVINVLKKLPLPVVDESVIRQSLAEKLVASVKHPESIMNVLKSFKDSIVLDQNYAKCLLIYFARHVENTDQAVDWRCLGEIPMFCAIGGRTTSISFQAPLLVPICLPQDGLEVWSQKTKTALLDPELIPDEICRLFQLGKSVCTGCSLLWNRLLSTLDRLPQDAVDCHVLSIRHMHGALPEPDKDKLFKKLSQTAFIRVDPSTMCKPSEFHSPHNAVFKTLCDPRYFPPEPYCKPEWREFMERCGMVKDVTPQMFIKFARQVEGEGMGAVSRETQTKSKMLVAHLFGRDDLSELWNDVRNIRFVRPWSFELTVRIKLAELSPTFSGDRLVAFSESCLPCHWPLVWSKMSILHPDDDPTKRLTNQKLKQLNLKLTIPKKEFENHVESVCQTLRSPTCDLLAFSEGRKEVEWLFTNIYVYLTELDRLDFFKDLPMVFDSHHSRLLYPEQVVFNLRSSETIDGWLFCAPRNYDKFFKLFESLGVYSSVTADHYARVLCKLHEVNGSQSLEDDMWSSCRKAVQGVFRCLQSEPSLNKSVLYLPNEHYCLKASTSLIFNDDDILHERLQGCSERFLLDFRQLDIPCGSISLLPVTHKMAQLSKKAREEIRTSSLSGALEFRRKLSSAEFVNGVTRLVYHTHVNSEITNSRQKIRNNLYAIEVLQTEELHTVVVVDGEEIPDSESYHKILRDERHVCRVLVDSKASFSDDSVVRTLVDVIIEAVSKELSEFRSLLQSMLRCHDIQALLDQNGISYFRQTDTCKPGCYVNIDDVCLLQNDVTSLYMDDEDVVMEVFDPLIDSEQVTREAGQISTQRSPDTGFGDSEADETNESCQNPPSDAETNSHQVFIYARVTERIFSRERQNVAQPCRMSYRVDIGHGRTLEVSAVRLYKVPKAFDEMETPHLALQQSSQTDPRPDDDDDDVLRDVKSCLEVSLPLLEERYLKLGLLKRLCLQWHPELNKRRGVCQKVVEVTKQVARVEASEASPRCGEQEPVDIPAAAPCLHLPPTAAFFERLEDRGRQYASQISVACRRRSDVGDQRKRENPQPGEGRRWLRQARADLGTVKGSSEKNYLHCLTCHQAVEKALKAVLFHKDADIAELNPAETTDLSRLASAVGKDRLREAVEELERLTGERWRMSYPFVQWAPQIPAHLYSPGVVQEVCRQAETILNMAASLLT